MAGLFFVGAKLTIDAAPLAATQFATHITTNTAVLNGMALPNGFSTTAWFQWGTSTNYGSSTVPVAVGAGNSVVLITNGIAGLVAGQAFHCRLVASNASGVAYGADQIFCASSPVKSWGYNSSGQTNIPAGLGEIVAISGGQSHSIALKADGSLTTWGGNAEGQRNVPALNNVVAVAAGGYHSLALQSDGTLAVWGWNIFGQSSVPAGMSNIISMAGGDYHSLALKRDGTVAAWGGNSYGQSTVPAGLSNVVAIARGFYHSLALSIDGTVTGWGWNAHGQTSIPNGLSNVVAIAGGYYHSMALKRDGTVVAWGGNASGQINVPASLNSVVAISAGNDHSIALKNDGTVVVWGSNGVGQTNIPPGLNNVAAISAGGHHNLTLHAAHANFPPEATSQTISGEIDSDIIITLTANDLNGNVLTFRIASLPANGTLHQCNAGNRGSEITETNTVIIDAARRVVFAPASGETGVPYAAFQFVANDGSLDSTPATITINVSAPGPTASTQPATGITSNTATLNGMVKPNGNPTTAWFEWGTNKAYGNVTIATNVGSGFGRTHVRLPITGLQLWQLYHCRMVASNAANVSFGADQSFGVGKKIQAWGYNDYGQGNIPAGLSNAVAITAGRHHGMALLTDSTVVGWGANNYGQATVPASLNAIVAVAAGDDHNLALRNDGTMVAWGYNGSGQTNAPAGLGNIIAIAAGASHSLALKSDGTVFAWGRNVEGQSTVPASLSNVVAIAAGYYFSLALKIDGSVVAWGDNSFGQRTVPTTLSNVVTIAAGGSHGVALRKDGTVAAWGNNSAGQSTVPTGLSGVTAIEGGGFHTAVIKNDGSVTVWGDNNYGQRNVPVGLSNLLAISAGYQFSLGLAANRTPVANSQTISGAINSDLIIGLSGSDADGDELSCRVVTLPVVGALYQCDSGSRGAVIAAANTLITDPNRRVIFAPSPDGFGDPYASFQFLVNDAMKDSSAAEIVIRIAAPRASAANTQPATHVSGNSATLNGMVVPNGSSTTVWFEWGATTAYGNVTATTNVGSGTSVTRVSLPVTGLMPNQIYHARLVASNAPAVTYGADQTFALARRIKVWGYTGLGQGNVPPGVNLVSAIASGAYHCLALKGDGTISAWGFNAAGQSSVPAGLSNVVAVAAGPFHSFAIKQDGTLASWGNNDAGQSSVPADLTNVIAVAGGSLHSVALRNDGTIVAWGDNGYGQTSVPLGLTNVVAIAAGYYHNLALRDNGTVVGWGAGSSTTELNNNYEQIIIPSGLTNVVAIAGGGYHSVALKSDGTVIAWGRNDRDQCNIPYWVTNIGSIAGGGYHNLALQKNGTVTAWGWSGYAQSSANETNAISIAAGDAHSMALVPNTPPLGASQSVSGGSNLDIVVGLSGNDVDGDTLSFRITTLPSAGTLYQYVAGNRGSAITSANPLLTDAGARVIFAPESDATGSPYASFNFIVNDGLADSPQATISISVGVASAFTKPPTALTAETAVFNGMVMANGQPTSVWFEWGASTAYGNQTVATNINSSNVAFISTAVDGLQARVYHCRLVASNVTGVIRGTDRIFGLGKNVQAWGRNDFGQTNVPAGLSNIVALEAGSLHSLALRSDGTVVGWGNNAYSQSSPPSGLTDVVGIAAGNAHSLALKRDGTVVAWGWETNVPTGLSNVIEIAAGASHSLALRSDGTVMAWGYNGFGQTNVPLGLGNVVAIAAGDSHNLALTMDGTVIGWGLNSYGQANSPSVTNPIVAVAAAYIRNLAIKNDGTLVAWGYNGDGGANVPPGLTNIVAIDYENIALKNDGAFIIWGFGGWGQTNVPPGLSNVVAFSGSAHHTLASVGNMTILSPSIAASLTTIGEFALSFSGITDTRYSVMASTNLTSWTVLGTAIEISPGQFQFNDSSTTNFPMRFYRVRWP